MNNYYKYKKLLTGIFLFSSFYFLNDCIGGSDGFIKMERIVKDYLMTYVSKDSADGLSALICLPISAYMVYAFVSGVFRICTFNQYLPVFEDRNRRG